jgi:hypothetical protein
VQLVLASDANYNIVMMPGRHGAGLVSIISVLIVVDQVPCFAKAHQHLSEHPAEHQASKPSKPDHNQPKTARSSLATPESLNRGPEPSAVPSSHVPTTTNSTTWIAATRGLLRNYGEPMAANSWIPDDVITDGIRIRSSFSSKLKVIGAGLGTSGTHSLFLEICAMGLYSWHWDLDCNAPLGQRPIRSSHDSGVVVGKQRPIMGTSNFFNWFFSGSSFHNFSGNYRVFVEKQRELVVSCLKHLDDQNVEAVMDSPTEYIFDDLLSAYPHATFVLTTRNASKWVQSRLTHAAVVFICRESIDPSVAAGDAELRSNNGADEAVFLPPLSHPFALRACSERAAIRSACQTTRKTGAGDLQPPILSFKDALLRPSTHQQTLLRIELAYLVYHDHVRRLVPPAKLIEVDFWSSDGCEFHARLESKLGLQVPVAWRGTVVGTEVKTTEVLLGAHHINPAFKAHDALGVLVSLPCATYLPPATGLRLPLEDSARAAPNLPGRVGEVELKLIQPQNVVIFISMAGPVTFIKRALLQRICTTSHLPVVVGYDAGQNASNINEVLSTRMSSHCPHEQIPLSFDALARRFEPHAASNFAGTPINSPSKLAPLLWLSKSRFSHMWHLEDDTWVNNVSKFVGQYATRRSDLVAHFVRTLPDWWHRGSWVGSKEHGLPDNVPSAPNYMSLACYRVSKTFAVALVTSITNDKTASHHEVYLPFVLNITRPTLSWSSLLPYHSPEVRFNPGGNFTAKTGDPCASYKRVIFRIRAPARSEIGTWRRRLNILRF